MRMVRNSKKTDQVKLDRDERLALEKTIQTCQTLASPKWAGDADAGSASRWLLILQARYIPTTKQEGEKTDGN